MCGRFVRKEEEGGQTQSYNAPRIVSNQRGRRNLPSFASRLLCVPRGDKGPQTHPRDHVQEKHPIHDNKGPRNPNL